MDDVRAEVKKWNPAEVERVTGVPGAQIRKVAELMAKNRPSTLIWCMGITQQTVGTANVRALCILQLALGNIGVAGGGANIFRGHCNVQGATDFGLDVTSLPAYYGLTEGRLEALEPRLGRRLRVDEGALRFPEVHGGEGHPDDALVRRASLAKPEEIEQPTPVKAMLVFGPRRQHRHPHAGNAEGAGGAGPAGRRRPASDDLRVGQRSGRTGPTCCRSAPSSRRDGSRTASNRSIQWGDRVVEPIFELKNDYDVMYALATRLGFGAEMFKRIKVVNGTAECRRHPAGNQLRLALDRVFGPVAGAAAAPHGASGRFRPDDAEGLQRAVRG